MSATTPIPLSVKPRTVAEMTGISEKTLANWRSLGVGPKFVRLGKVHGRIVYRVADVEAWLDAQVEG
ncbi:helix-turn-helix transcriptional regulator [Demequina sp.]|uniref:helix-turn-helix transcriptional regulator n=1 Tax=Demequina sp. TaxID=2050685 RepID=UPI003A887E69